MHSDGAPASKSTILEAKGAGLIPRPRVWTVFAAWAAAALLGEMAVAVGLQVTGIGIGIVLAAQGADAAMIQVRAQEILQLPLLALMTRLLPYQLGLLAMVLLVAWQSDEPLKQRLGLLPPSGRKLGPLGLTMLAAFTLSAALATVIGSTLFVGEPPASPIGASVEQGPWWTITLASVVLSLLPAVVEEIVFRGYIQRRLLQRWSPIAAIGVSTLLFAILHADSLQHIIAVIPLGIVTGLVAWRTNSSKPGMFLHAIHNAGAVGFSALARGLSSLVGDEGTGMALVGTIVVLSLIGLPAVIALLLRDRITTAPVSHVLPQTAVDLA